MSKGTSGKLCTTLYAVEEIRAARDIKRLIFLNWMFLQVSFCYSLNPVVIYKGISNAIKIFIFTVFCCKFLITFLNKKKKKTKFYYLFILYLFRDTAVVTLTRLRLILYETVIQSVNKNFQNGFDADFELEKKVGN